MDNFLFSILSFTILLSATADKFYHLLLGFTAWLCQEFNSIASENKIELTNQQTNHSTNLLINHSTNQPINKQTQNSYFVQKKFVFDSLLKKS